MDYCITHSIETKAWLLLLLNLLRLQRLHWSLEIAEGCEWAQIKLVSSLTVSKDALKLGLGRKLLLLLELRGTLLNKLWLLGRTLW